MFSLQDYSIFFIDYLSCVTDILWFQSEFFIFVLRLKIFCFNLNPNGKPVLNWFQNPGKVFESGLEIGQQRLKNEMELSFFIEEASISKDF